MKEDHFEWNEAKAEINLAKHRVSFETASRVFDDVFAVYGIDFDSDPSEIRYLITGMVNGILLTAIYTERGDRVRIISARKATASEGREYDCSQAAE